MVNAASVAAFLGLAASSLALVCNPTNYPYAGQSVSVPLVQQSFANPKTGVKTTFSGKFTIIDGCTVQLTDVSMTSAAASQMIQLWGSTSASSTTGFPLSTTSIYGDYTNQNYPGNISFIGASQPNIPESFYDFSHVMLIATDTYWLIAAGDLPATANTSGAPVPAPAPSGAAPVPAPATSGAAPAPSKPSSAASSPSAGSTSDASKISMLPAVAAALVPAVAALFF